MKGDRRFLLKEPGLWQAAPLEELLPPDRPLDEVVFVITDIETTGSLRGSDRIIDLAAIKVLKGQEIDRFEELVNPQKKISRHITRLTGIQNEDVEQAPPIEEVMPRFIDFMGDSVLVAHNAPFDFNFINAEIDRLGMPRLKLPLPVCTFAVARRLLPELRACGVTGLSHHFGYEVDDRHRAMPDVMATHFFLNRFLEDLKEREITTLYQLVNFQKEKLSKEQVLKRIKRQESKRVRSKGRPPKALGA
ncbi:MAG: exonuclease domain-containing protein [bacterium]|nr:exonuclease domain-containing protein [bacterium]